MCQGEMSKNVYGSTFNSTKLEKNSQQPPMVDTLQYLPKT